MAKTLRLKLSMKKIVILILIILITAGSFGYYIKSEVFPFISLKHTDSVEKFNSIPDRNMILTDSKLDLKIKFSPYFKNKIEEEVLPLITDKNDVISVCGILTGFVRSNMKATYNVVNDLDVIISSAEPYPGICSGYSKLLSAAAQSAGLPSRVVWLSGHTVSEIYFRDYGWVLVDTSSNAMYKFADNHFASVLDTVLSFNKVTPVKIIKNEEPDDDPFDIGFLRRVMPDNKILVVLEGPSLLDFNIKMKSVKKIILYAMGKDLVKGIQFVKNRKKSGNKRIEFQIFILFELFLSILLLKFVFSKVVNIYRYTRKKNN